MKKIKLTTPENIEVEYKLADLGSRTGAVIIDLMIQGVIFSFMSIFLLIVSSSQPELWDVYYGWIIGIFLFLSAVITYGYYIFMELKMNGRTLGKKFLNLRTIRENGQAITLKHSAIRNLFRVFIDMSGLGALLIFFTSKHKRIGDFVASTIVVVEEKKSRPVVLETKTEHFKDYISKEEYELLCDYYRRKNSLQNHYILKDKIKDYFVRKYEGSEIITEIREVIEGI